MKKKVWVVEDDPDIGEVISFLLNDEGYEVSLFPNASSFKQQLANADADMMVMDVMLPDGNGIELCHDVKTSGSLKHVPVLMMSANKGLSDLNGYYRADDFIAKPFDIDEFMRKVKRLVT
jgi:DNA-binding response OmpR family regulator